MESILQYHEDPYYGAKLICGGILLLWAIVECLYSESSSETKLWNDPAFSIFMCVGNLLLLSWFWGISIYVWRSRGIDFCRLMGLEETALVGSQHPEKVVFSTTAGYSIIFLFLFITYTRSIRTSTTSHSGLTYAHSLPVLLLATSLAGALHPWNSKRKWFIMLYNVLMAPLFPVGFRDGYIGDLLTSLVRITVPLVSGTIYALMAIAAWLMNDFTMLGSPSTVPWWEQTFLFSNVLVPLAALYPLWIRLLQCLRRSAETGNNWPHHGNALKYTSAISVIAFGTFQPAVRKSTVWISYLVGATLFQLVWDVTMDWGLLTYKKPSGYKASHGSWKTMLAGIHLRSSRLLGPAWVYVAVLLFNTVFRFAWTLTVWPYSLGNDGSDPLLLQVVFRHTGPLLAAAEVVRRMVWGWLRVEFEHIEVLGLAVAPPGSTGLSKEVAITSMSHSQSNPSDIHKSSEVLNEERGNNSQRTETVSAMELADRNLGSFEKMEVASSVPSGGAAIAWLTSFSPFTWSSAPSSSSSSFPMSGSGRESTSRGSGAGPGGALAGSQWQWSEAMELVVLPDSVLSLTRYFSLDLERLDSAGGGVEEGRGVSRGSKHRARFVESVLFCGAVGLIILVAAGTR